VRQKRGPIGGQGESGVPKTEFFCSLLFTIFLLTDFKRKPDSTLVLKTVKNKNKKFCEPRKLESIQEYQFEERKTEGRKPDRDLKLRRLSLWPKPSPRQKMPFKNSISGYCQLAFSLPPTHPRPENAFHEV
jgi:hypothetical protein